ncbi:AMP-binding protein [Streptomyces sp. MMBL 11-3]|uniref:AMP-binding protein n=1 Tax=Streptomyces sp. MMBL 11-3 TaxID=3382639 RepID=UPI0039B6022F
MTSVNDSVLSHGSLVGVLRKGAEENPNEIIYAYLREGAEIEDSLTRADLDRTARARAALLQESGLTGRHAILAYPHGLEFIRAFSGCLYAGIAGVPVKFPGRRADLARLVPIAESAGTTTVLTTRAGHRELLERFPDAPELHELNWIETDTVTDGQEKTWTAPDIALDHLALLQFTSGSTGHPKGVMVSHRNFAQQAAALKTALGFGHDSVIVSWLPFFHDFGLVFSVVAPLRLGVPAYLMSPSAFVRRPRRLLEAVSRFRGTHVGSPDFGYDLCVRSAAHDLDQLDLSSWRVALNGAEPVRDATLRRFTETFKAAGFDPRAYSPAYGLAEGTLVVSAKRVTDLPRTIQVSAAALAESRVVVTDQEAADATPLISCGPALPDTVVRIVDPVDHLPRGEEEIGEIWVRGASVAQGYWRLPEATKETFGARISGQESEGVHLRTGDLGFLQDGQLFVTGRRKDVIILQGHNYYPQDIEYVAESCHPSLASGSAAAFALERDGEEQLAVVVEVTGAALEETTADLFAQRVRDAVWSDCQLPVSETVIVRRGALSRTTSGKIQRRECRHRLENGEFSRLTLAVLSGRGNRPVPVAPSANTSPTALPSHLLKPMVRTLLSRITEVPTDGIADDQSFADYGLSSLGAQQLAAAIEPVVGRPVPVEWIFNHPTVVRLTAVLGQPEGHV